MEEGTKVFIKGFIKWDGGFLEVNSSGIVATTPRKYAKNIDVYLDSSPTSDMADGTMFVCPRNIVKQFN